MPLLNEPCYCGADDCTHCHPWIQQSLPSADEEFDFDLGTAYCGADDTCESCQ